MVRLVQRTFLSTRENAPRQVVFCGVGRENGSSAVCANAGRTLAALSSRSVCLVDANLRSSQLLRLLESDNALALNRKPATISEQCIAVSHNLWFAGTDLLADEGGGLASMARLREIFVELRGMFEFVLLDAPGADISADAAILDHVSDGTLLIIDAESTRRITARKAKESLEAADVRLLGAVLHNRTFPIPKSLYEKL